MSYPSPELEADELWLDELRSMMQQGQQGMLLKVGDLEDQDEGGEDGVADTHAHPNTPVEYFDDEALGDSIPSLSGTTDPSAPHSILQTPFSSPARSAHFSPVDLCLAIQSAGKRQEWDGEEEADWRMGKASQVVSPGGMEDLLSKGLGLTFGVGTSAQVESEEMMVLKRAGRRMLGDDECEAVMLERWGVERGCGVGAGVGAGVGLRRVQGGRASFFIA